MLYAIALGSNQRHARYGSPEALIEEALRRVPGILLARSTTLRTRPIGPSQRVYANAAAILETDLAPAALLCTLQSIEADLGRRRRGQRWRARPIDLDILLWSEGVVASPALTIPHRAMRARSFVLAPLAQIAPDWRDPVTALQVRHLLARLRKPRRPS